MNLQMERDEDGGGSEQPSSSSDVEQSFLAFRKMIEPMVLNILRGAMKQMVISTIHEVIEPVAEVLLRKVVKEEIQLVEERLSGGTRNDLPVERNLQLKFLNEVSDTVLTCTELKGVEDDCLKLALFDTSKHIVTYGPESSARVEIVLLDANGNDDENMTNENFETRIIRTGDKEKPHFVNSVSIKLDKGVGNLIGLKLGQDSGWTKSWKCMLGARMQNCRGIIVQEAWTAPFKVADNRIKHYEKDVCPSPSSHVWKLKEIGRDGNPYRRLKGKNINTVLEFLFWLSVNPKELQEKILGARESRWETIVAHAKTCIIDDKKLYYHKSSTEPQMCVIYDAVGKLQGVIDESHFVPIKNLSADKKDHAHKLLMSVLDPPSAFVERYKTFFNDKVSLLQQFPSRSSGTDASSNSNIQQSLNGGDLPTLSENIDRYWPTGPGLSSQSIIPSDIIDTGPFDSLGSRDTAPGPFLDPENFGGDTPTDPDYEKPFDDMDHIRQNLSGGGKQINAGTSEMVRDSSSRRLDTSFPSTSSTMNSFGENGVLDFGTTISATDLFKITDDAGTQHNHAYQGSPDSLFEDIHIYEQQYCGVCVEPLAVSTRYVPNGWNFLLCVLKWRFSVSRNIRRVRHVTRKRKR